MKKTNYNGWTNYETWKVALWIDNDHYYYETSRQAVKDAKDAGESGTELEWWIAEQIRDTVESDINSHRVSGTLIGDLAFSALAEVNWREIARNIIEEE